MQQVTYTYAVLTEDQKIGVFDPTDDLCPFHGYIGNEKAVQLAIMLAKNAFVDYVVNGYPCQSRKYPMRIRLTGPASVGKTTFAKNLTKLIGTDYRTGKWLMPFAEIDASSIKRREQIFDKIKTAMAEKDLELIPLKEVNGITYYHLPPLVLFIDEVHVLPGKVMEGLLKMTEMSDGIFETDKEIVNCKDISIIIATTNPGKLQSAFKTRFPTHIALQKHTVEQVAEIVQNTVGWEWDYCLRLAKMKNLPREAKQVAQFIKGTMEIEKSTLKEAFDKVVKNLDLTEIGLSKRALEVLRVLKESPSGLSKRNICSQLSNMDEEEFDSEIIPQLLSFPPLIAISQRHKITEHGLKVLEESKI